MKAEWQSGMVEVFKTNIKTREEAANVMSMLLEFLPLCKINIDLDDCDKILRIESQEDISILIEGILAEKGFLCSVLE